MFHDRASWRMKMRCAGLALALAYLSLVYLDGPAARAESAMRMPSINIPTRTPTIAPTIAPPVTHIDPGIAGRAVTGLGRTTPNLKTYQGCSYAYRDSNGACSDQPISSADGGSGGASGKGKGKNNGPRRNNLQVAQDVRAIANEILAVIDGSQADELARRHGLTRLASQNFPLVGATIGLFRINDGRTVDAVSRELGRDGVRSV
jgi:hypothetical protein